MFCIKMYNPETKNTWKIRRQNNGLQWVLMKRKKKYEGVPDEDLVNELEKNVYSNNSVYYSNLDHLLEKCIRLELLDKDTNADVEIDLSEDIKESLDEVNKIIKEKVDQLIVSVSEDPLFSADSEY